MLHNVSIRSKYLKHSIWFPISLSVSNIYKCVYLGGWPISGSIVSILWQICLWSLGVGGDTSLFKFGVKYHTRRGEREHRIISHRVSLVILSINYFRVEKEFLKYEGGGGSWIVVSLTFPPWQHRLNLRDFVFLDFSFLSPYHMQARKCWHSQAGSPMSKNSVGTLNVKYINARY